MALSGSAALCFIVLLGVGGQWLAWQLHLPSILILLVAGILSGPILGLLDPSALFGDLLLPLVSVFVGIILFEGGLSLRLEELRPVGRAFFGLATIGVGMTFLLSSFGALVFLHYPAPLALLFGGILVVTGPTVIGPLLQHVRPSGKVASILRWEGIGLDPLGALLALAVYESAFMPESISGSPAGLIAIGKAVLAGSAFALIIQRAVLFCFRRSLIPEHLQSPITLLGVLLAFASANAVASESGLVAVTVLGILLSNQRSVDLEQILRFKETLSVLLISILFILLGARLSYADISGIKLEHLYFVCYLILVVRPLAVFASTTGAGLPMRERTYISFFAPRGIVAAAVTSVFAIALEKQGVREAAQLVPAMFVVILATVSFYGLLSRPLAGWLGLIKKDPQGILFVGANSVVRKIALALKGEGIAVMLVDSTWSNVSAARMEGLAVHFGSILSSRLVEEIDLGDLGKLCAMSSNSELNALACVRFKQIFAPQNVYQLGFDHGNVATRRKDVDEKQRGRPVFEKEMSLAEIECEFGPDPTIKLTKFTKEFDYRAFLALYGERSIGLYILSGAGTVLPISPGETIKPEIGQTLVSLVRAVESKST